jgi:hypothetical protein
MSVEELLPDDLLWADGGHASDVVLTALADGQTSIVPSAVRAHVERCETCAAHLGNAALLSLYVGAELEARKKHETVPERLPLPRLAIVLGLVVAVLGLVPSLLAGDATYFALQDIPLVARAASTLLRHVPEGASLVLTYGGSMVLVVAALAATRLLPKKEVSR